MSKEDVQSLPCCQRRENFFEKKKTVGDDGGWVQLRIGFNAGTDALCKVVDPTSLCTPAMFKFKLQIAPPHLHPIPIVHGWSCILASSPLCNVMYFFQMLAFSTTPSPILQCLCNPPSISPPSLFGLVQRCQDLRPGRTRLGCPLTSLPHFLPLFPIVTTNQVFGRFFLNFRENHGAGPIGFFFYCSVKIKLATSVYSRCCTSIAPN